MFTTPRTGRFARSSRSTRDAFLPSRKPFRRISLVRIRDETRIHGWKEKTYACRSSDPKASGGSSTLLGTDTNPWNVAGVHATACIHPDARVSPSATVGPYCVVGPRVRIGDGCVLQGHNVILGDVSMGEGCVLLHGAVVGSEDPGEVVLGARNRIGHHAVVGVRCQDLKLRIGHPTYLRMGNDNDVREHASIHRSSDPQACTIVGDGNLIMGQVHLAHDVHLGHGNIIANGTLLAGHVHVGDRVGMGGGCAVQQRCRVGSYAYLAGGSMVERDVPPYVRVQGDRAKIRGINSVLLQRCGFSEEATRSIRRAYRALWLPKDGGDPASTPHSRACELLEANAFHGQSHALALLEFVVDSCSAREKGDTMRIGSICRSGSEVRRLKAEGRVMGEEEDES